jgi:hypothetical protein
MLDPRRQQRLKEAIEATAAPNGDTSKEGVAIAAKDPGGNPHFQFLHDEMEAEHPGIWDNDSAAFWAQCEVAGRLIRQVVYLVHVPDRGTVETVKYLRHVARPKTYSPIDIIAEDRDLSRKQMLMELHRCESAIRRARNVSAALNLLEELEDLLHRIVCLREAAEEDSPKHKPRRGGAGAKKRAKAR